MLSCRGSPFWFCLIVVASMLSMHSCQRTGWSKSLSTEIDAERAYATTVSDSQRQTEQSNRQIELLSEAHGGLEQTAIPRELQRQIGVFEIRGLSRNNTLLVLRDLLSVFGVSFVINNDYSVVPPQSEVEVFSSNDEIAQNGGHGSEPMYAFEFVGGSLVDLLDQLSLALDVIWHWNGFAVEVREFDQVVEHIAVGDWQGVEVEGAGAGVANEEYWQAISDAIAVLCSQNCLSHLSSATGEVLVQGPVGPMRRVRAYLKELNRTSRKQIELQVRLLRVDLSLDQQYGIDWSLVRSALGASWSIAGGQEVNEAQFIVDADSSDGSESALFGAINAQGQVRILTAPHGVTLNNQPMRLALVTETSYLERTTTTSVVTGGTDTQQFGLEPGVVETGFTLNVLPRIDGQAVLLELDINVSSLTEIEEVESGDQLIQIPVLTESRFSHRVRLDSGQTLIIGGIRQLQERNNSEWFQGKSLMGRDSERILLITPRII